MRAFAAQDLEEIIAEARKTGSEREIIASVRNYIPYGKAGLSLAEANELLLKHDCKFLPIVDENGNLNSVVFDKDLRNHQEHPLALVDDQKRLLASAGINTHDYKKRVRTLVEAGVDILFVDSSNGFTEYQKECIEWVKNNYHIPIVGGNVITKEAFDYLVGAGADAVKIGMGGGSICITQEQKGVGRGQASALYEIAKRREEYFEESGGMYVPLICDGGIVHPKDIAMAYAFGADVVMMGRWFARLDESPSEIRIRGGQPFKPYWGEGTEKAKNWQRYQEGEGGGKLAFEEGIEGWVPYVGSLHDNLIEAVSKIQAFFAENARLNIEEMHDSPIHVERVSLASIREGRAHDVLIDPSTQTVFTDRLGQYSAKEWGLDNLV
jgi:IMP dehydrogenase